MVKKPIETKGVVPKVLKRRITVTKGKTLGRDVTMPKWLRAIGGYFKGAVSELRQVKWPSRKATWSFTVAVIAFTFATSAFILALDFGFEQLFKQVIL